MKNIVDTISYKFSSNASKYTQCSSIIEHVPVENSVYVRPTVMYIHKFLYIATNEKLQKNLRTERADRVVRLLSETTQMGNDKMNLNVIHWQKCIIPKFKIIFLMGFSIMVWVQSVFYQKCQNDPYHLFRNKRQYLKSSKWWVLS